LDGQKKIPTQSLKDNFKIISFKDMPESFGKMEHIIKEFLIKENLLMLMNKMVGKIERL